MTRNLALPLLLFVGLAQPVLAAPQFVQGPGARFAHAMAYDSQREVVVLFGGAPTPGTALDDTWEWNGEA